MTDEQIKQNAEVYARYSSRANNTAYYAYIEGAHSCDEEISRMQESLDECKRALFQLRNPWISVEKHPIDVTKDYLLEYEDGSHIVAMWDSGMWMSKNLHPLKEPIRWMPISELQKEE